MTTRREFVQGLRTIGAAFAEQPFKGHFHPQGKAPSSYTLEVLKQVVRGCRS